MYKTNHYMTDINVYYDDVFKTYRVFKKSLKSRKKNVGKFYVELKWYVEDIEQFDSLHIVRNPVFEVFAKSAGTGNWIH